MKRWNHYVCPKCRGVTIAEHVDEGVTPFMLRCRVKDTKDASGNRVQGCNGMAESTFFSGSQDDAQVPHVIFYRPADAMVAIEEINKEPRRFREGLLDHYRRGGALLREADQGVSNGTEKQSGGARG